MTGVARIWRWLTIDTVLAMHDEQIADHGGGTGLRDRGLLESALAKPMHLATYGEPDAAALAAAYASGIARNHPFVDGNKRRGHAAIEAMLMLNGFELLAPVDESERMIMKVAAGNSGRNELLEWIRRHSGPV